MPTDRAVEFYRSGGFVPRRWRKDQGLAKKHRRDGLLTLAGMSGEAVVCHPCLFFFERNETLRCIDARDFGTRRVGGPGITGEGDAARRRLEKAASF